MLFGACDYLADMYMESIIETAGAGCDMLKMYFDEYSFEEAKSFKPTFVFPDTQTNKLV